MEYNARSLEQSAMQIAGHGIQVVKLYGVNDDFTCTCGTPGCSTPGKHPAGGGGWQHRATYSEDEIAEWFENGERLNIGILLGRESGIVDVEVDGPEAQEVLERFGLDQIATPTYRAHRGEHRIFRYNDRLPDVAVVKVEGLEVRTGGGGRAAQSVAPVSWHGSGVQYRWLDGLSIDDVPPAELPPDFMEAILGNARQRGGGAVARAGEVIAARRRVGAGDRHQFLLGVTSRYAAKIRRFTDADRAELHELVYAFNQVYCDPPKDLTEFSRLIDDQFNYYRNRAEERRNAQEQPLATCGLQYDDVLEEWEPGSWSLTVIKGDPAQYRLRIPSRETPGKIHTVSMLIKEWDNASEVARLVVESTQEFDVKSPNGTRWGAIWSGERVRQGEGWRDRKSLKIKLWERREVQEASAGESQYVSHMNILLAYVYQLSKIDDGDEESSAPPRSGDPKWVKRKDGQWQLMFQWDKLVGAAWADRRLASPNKAERLRLARELKEIQGRAAWGSTTVRSAAGQPVTVQVWSEADVAAIEKAVGA
jgi:hypothetical protein